MGRKKNNLTPLAVSKLSSPGLHFVGHIPGLAIRVSNAGARSWILRSMIGGKRRDMGLGSFPEVSFARAREIAAEKRSQVRNGLDPIAVRRDAKATLKADQASFISFKGAAEAYIAAHENSWKNLKHRHQWRNTLEIYAYPIIGSLHVRDISLNHVIRILEPIWNEKSETANRVRGRIETVLDWARARGHRSGDNPAHWRGNLSAIFPAKSKIAQVKHHAALAWMQAPSFFMRLRKENGVSARALELAVLTACRSGEVRGATWAEIDVHSRVWTIPASRMKSAKEHRVPLSDSAIALLESMPNNGPGSIIFPGKNGNSLSDMALSMLLRRMEDAVTVHGFRSTFRDWAGETTDFAREVIEHALAHQIKDKVEAAYARSDLFLKRSKLMSEWDKFLSQRNAADIIDIAVQNSTDSQNFTVVSSNFASFTS